MTVDPFIEAEEVAGHGAERLSPARGLPCRPLQRRNGVPSKRELTDADLTEKIRAIQGAHGDNLLL